MPMSKNVVKPMFVVTKFSDNIRQKDVLISKKTFQSEREFTSKGLHVSILI